MNVSEASEMPLETENDCWEELMGRDLMMTKYTSDSCPIIFRNLPPLDSDLCTDHSQECVEIGDYAVISYAGYFSRNGDIRTDDVEQLKKDLECSESHLVKFVHADNWIIKLGSANVVPGLEMATRFLSKGEAAIVKCHSKYAYYDGRLNSCQDDGSKEDLRENTNIVFQVTLREIIPLGKALKPSFRLKLGIHLKVMGNDAYKYEWIPSNQGGNGKTKALKLYGNASQELISLMKDSDEHILNENMDQEMKLQCVKNLVDCFNNIASVHLRAKDYGKAKEAATEAIKIDQDNVKAICKAAKASLMLTDFDECEAVLEVLQNLDGANRDVQRLRKDFYDSRSLYKKKEKELYSKMMSNERKTMKIKQSVVKTKLESSEPNINNTRNSAQDAVYTVSECKESILSGRIPIFISLISFIVLMLYLKYFDDTATRTNMDL